ncbi:terminase small subunit [Neobacillus piezotolerans]|uniref:terminase small subunit n=1 Tax=Neobacillus piezotolerans TaxID=2259171 RepID=UPI000E1E16FC|nr:terminase small subunit [Neobacillus piezotolerans]
MRAGYSQKTVIEQGSRMLRNVKVRARIEKCKERAFWTPLKNPKKSILYSAVSAALKKHCQICKVLKKYPEISESLKREYPVISATLKRVSRDSGGPKKGKRMQIDKD